MSDNPINQEPELSSENKPEEKKILSAKESVDFLKRLADLNSKKEEFLGKLSELSNRMQARLNKDTGLPEASRTEPMPRFMKVSPHESTTSIPSMLHSGQDLQGSIKYTRVKDVQAPAKLNSSLVFYLPAGVGIIQDENYVMLPDTGMVLELGVKVAVPAGMGLIFWSIDPELSITSKNIISEDNNHDEIMFRVSYPSSHKVIKTNPLFMATPFLMPKISMEELFNSTYESYIHGTVR